MTDEANKKFTVAYTEGTSLTVYTFDSMAECGAWETDMIALKHEMEGVNETYISFDSRKCAAYARWLVNFNTFVRVWSNDRTPGDIVLAKDSLVAALVSKNWPVPV
jgi:hypothetical protein